MQGDENSKSPLCWLRSRSPYFKILTPMSSKALIVSIEIASLPVAFPFLRCIIAALISDLRRSGSRFSKSDLYLESFLTDYPETGTGNNSSKFLLVGLAQLLVYHHCLQLPRSSRRAFL